MDNFTFTYFKDISKPYIENEEYKIGHTQILTDSNILISAPHGVLQTRLGKEKLKEPGSVRFALVLQKELNSNIILKTKNMFDDANFDIDCPYRTDMCRIIEEKGIKYLLDIHCLASYRSCDVNLGVNIGENIKTDKPLFNKIEKALKEAGFVVSIDNPFAGKYPTISADMHKRFGIWAMQVEINSSITNKFANESKLEKLLNVFIAVFSNLN